MLLILPVLIFLLVSLIILIVRLANPKFAFHWLITMAGAIIAWPLVLLSGLRLPQSYSMINWNHEALFSAEYLLQADQHSWPITLALVTLTLAMLLSSAQDAREERWVTWAGSCTLTAIGMTAVQAGNPYTLLTAWTALDFIELIILLTQVHDSRERQQIILTISTRLCGSLVLIWAGVVARSTGQILDFTTVSSPINYYLYLAAILRIGVLPLHAPHRALHKGLGALISLVPAASGLILFTRTANIGGNHSVSILLIGMVSIAALITTVFWFAEKDRYTSRSFWILGMCWFVLSAALRARPDIALVWSLACLLPGGLLFLSRPERQAFFPFPLLGLAAISALPFAPSWIAIDLYQPSAVIWGNFYIPVLLLAHALFLAGYAYHATLYAMPPPVTERWAKASISLGLALLPIIHFLLGRSSLPYRPSSPPLVWLAAVISIGLAFPLWMLRKRSHFFQAYADVSYRIFSFAWLFRFLGVIDKGIRRILGWINGFLEGEAGILWALLLLALILSILAAGLQGGQ